MSPFILHTSRPHESILPRPHSDPLQRLHTYGPIQPMEEPGFLRRLFRRR